MFRCIICNHIYSLENLADADECGPICKVCYEFYKEVPQVQEQRDLPPHSQTYPTTTQEEKGVTKYGKTQSV